MATKLTYEQYIHFPDDGLRHEIIDGEHYTTTAQSTRHQGLLMRLVVALHEAIDQVGGEAFFAPLDVVLSPHDVVQPDYLFLARDHLDRLTEDNLQGAPDLVVEIVSEATRGRDLGLKRRLYAQRNVPEYWVIDPVTDSVKVYRMEGGDYLRGTELLAEAEDRLGTPLLPGLSLTLANLFAEKGTSCFAYD